MNLLEARVRKYIDLIQSKIYDNHNPMFLSSDIYTISDICELLNLNLAIDDRLFKYAEENDLAMNDDDNFWKNYNDMYYFNNVIASMYEQIPSLTYDPNFPVTSSDDVFKMVSDFFKNYDSNVFSHFSKLLSGNYIYRCDNLEDSYATTFNLMTLGCDYILYDGSESNIVLSMTIIHEVIHSYVNSLLGNISLDERLRFNINALDEVYSHFIEHAFIKYLRDINYNSDVVDNLSDFVNFSLASHLYSFSHNFNNFNEDDLYEYVISEIYSYGSLLGLVYYYKYLDNPLEAKEDVLNLTMDSTRYDKSNLLDIYGFDEGEFSKVLINHFR